MRVSHPFDGVGVVGDAALVRLVEKRHDTVALAFVTEEVHAGLVVYLSIKNRSAATTLPPAVSDRCAAGPRSFGGTFWNPGVKTERTAKKRRKHEQKWARYGLRKRVWAAVL